MRQTNQNIIRELIPKLEAKIKLWEAGKIGLDSEYGEKGYLRSIKYLIGKYDRAGLEALIQNNEVSKIFYSKEYAGCGNGFYALIERYTGHIIAGEWD